MNKIEFNAYDTNIEVSENGNVSGYCVVWGVVNRKKDIHYPEAYKRTVNNFKGLPLLPNHNQNDPIGTVTSLEIDEYGLKFSATFASTETAQKYRTLLQEGHISKFSFGWTALRWKRNEFGGRDIQEVKMFEVSPVAVPVGEEAGVLEVNSIEINEEPMPTLDRFYNLAKDVGDKKKKLATQAELLKLAEKYKQLEETTHSPDGTASVVEDALEDQAKHINELNETLKNYLKNGR